MHRRDARFGGAPTVGAGNSEVEKLRDAAVLLPVFQRRAPRVGVDAVVVGFLDDAGGIPGTVVDAEAGKVVEIKIDRPIHIGRQAFAVPAFQRGAPRAVSDRDAIGFPVLEHAQDAFVGGHNAEYVSVIVVGGSSARA